LPSILHVSDLHFGPKHLPELSAALLESARSWRPSVVAISGDLTQRAKAAQFRDARAWMEALPAPVAFVPGNHDVPLWRVWERAFAPFAAWRRHFDRRLVADHVDDDVALLGLNTAHAWTTKHGRVRPADLTGLAARLDAAPEGALRVVMAHHPMRRCSELSHEPAARRAAATLTLCARAGVSIVLGGHLHVSFWQRPEGGDGERGPLVAHCGTTTSSRGRAGEVDRNSLQWIEFDRETVRVERRLWDPGRGAFEHESALEFARRA